MNTIQCPVCRQELEGDFQMTNTVKCPTCETAFVPANVLARRKEPIVLKTRGAESSNSFVKEDAGVQDSAPSSRDESREKTSQGTNHETRNERPKQIVWTVTTWIGALVFRNIVLFCFVVAALTTGDNAFFESEIALYFTSCFVVIPVSVVVAWHLYKGKHWAKVLYSVFAVFSLLTAPIYHFGTKAMSMDSMVREHITFLPNWVLNIGVLWGVIVLVVFICGLRWVNKKESRSWLKSKKGSPNNTPWWIWAVLFNLLSVVAFVLVISSQSFKKTGAVNKCKTTSTGVDSLATAVGIMVNESGSTGGITSPHATYAAGERYVIMVSGISIPLRWCPAGSFTMGSPATEDERENDETQHRVTLTNGFWLGETEVTQGLWKKVMGDNPSYFKSGDEYPVEQVSWNDCQKFLKMFNAQAPVAGYKWTLPTEAQWEYACRAGTTTAYFWGDALNGNQANCDGNYPCGTPVGGPFKQQTTPVGSYVANPWGFFDMHGNVWEWCADCYVPYPSGVVTDPSDTSSNLDFVCRGGSWDNAACACRSALRNYYIPDFSVKALGFRVALVPVQ